KNPERPVEVQASRVRLSVAVEVTGTEHVYIRYRRIDAAEEGPVALIEQHGQVSTAVDLGHADDQVRFAIAIEIGARDVVGGSCQRVIGRRLKKRTRMRRNGRGVDRGREDLVHAVAGVGPV